MYKPSELQALIIREERPLPVGSRAQSKERNRQKILESAMTLFRERGYEAATLRDIARGAGLSTGALFANFTDKTEIFLTVIEEENARVIQTMIDAHDPSLPLIERLHKQLIRGFEVARENAKLILSAFVMRWSQNDAGLTEVSRLADLVRVALLDTLKDALARQELPADARIEYAAEKLEDLCFANLRRAFAGAERPEILDISAMADRLSIQIGLVVSGLKTA
jgi:AcrR family transcriptional regulator